MNIQDVSIGQRVEVIRHCYPKPARKGDAAEVIGIRPDRFTPRTFVDVRLDRGGVCTMTATDLAPIAKRLAQMSDQQVAAAVAVWSDPGITAKEFGAAHEATTAAARKRLTAVAAAGLIVDTGYVRFLARDGALIWEHAADIKRVPGGSKVYRNTEGD